MKATHFVCLCAAIALPQLALATASTNGSTDPQGLGIVHAVLEFCAQVDPRDQASFGSLKVLVSHGTPSNVEGTDAYQKGYNATRDALARVSRDDGVRACAAAVAPPSTHVTHGARRGTDSHPVHDDKRH